MKTRTPLDRDDLKIGKKDFVLEIGSGHNPSFRSDVIVDKYIHDNSNRCGNIKIYHHQKFVNADGENLPFSDKEFDYVICNQVLEHTDNPEKFISELQRVAKRGYLETPSLLGEFLFPKESHKWVILWIDNKLILFNKEKMPGNYNNNYGELFLNYLPFQSLAYKLLWYTEKGITLNKIEWEGEINVLVNPEDEKYTKYFTKKWDKDMVRHLFPKRKLYKELYKIVNAILYLIKRKTYYICSTHETPMDINEYLGNRIE